MKLNKKNITLLITSIFVILIIFFNDENQQNEEMLTSEGAIFVTRIVDGDTFEIETGQKVRMIGIDTPERGQYFYDEATNRLEELIGNKQVILKKDVSETDRYGRLLRHVYYENVWINKKMIDEGFAKFVTFPPDVYHVDEFKQAQRNAKEKGVGLWKE